MEDDFSVSMNEVAMIVDGGMEAQTLVDDLIKPARKRTNQSCRRVVSKMWAHFTKDEENKFCYCNYCGKRYKCDSHQSGTSNLWTHLREQCKRYWATLDDEKQSKITRFNTNKKSTSGSGETRLSGSASNFGLVGKFNQEDCRRTIAMYFVLNEVPFREIESYGFHLLCDKLCPKFAPPSRRTLVRDIYQLYLDEKIRLKSLFTSNRYRVCLTTDTWTSIQNFNYMVVTAHWIDDDWKLHKRILSFTQTTSHKGESIGRLIETCLLEWGIDRLMTITVDNASANDVAINYVKRRFKNWNNDGLVLDGAFLHLRCCAHIINLIVNEGLKDLHNSIASIRNAIMYVKSSPSRMHKFKLCVERERIDSKGLLGYDVPTRWNSTYLMLLNAIKFRKAFERLEEEESDGPYMNFFNEDERGKKRIGPPTTEDWLNAEIFVKFLRFFNDVTVDFSATLSVTSNMYFHHLCNIQNQLHSLIINEDELLSKMAFNMKTKCDKYWGSIGNINKLLILAVVLDPRYKLDYVSFCFGQLYDNMTVEEMTSSIKNILMKVYECYYDLVSTSRGTTQPNNVGSSSMMNVGSSSMVNVENECDIGLQFMDMKAQYKQLKIKKGGIDLKNEVEKYLFEPNDDEYDDNFDILEWWKENSVRFRILSRVARDVLAIPVSTVASESVFSTGGRILDSFRSSLTPKMVEALICTQQWLKASGMSEKYIKKTDIEALSSSFDDFEICESIEKEAEILTCD